MDERCLRESRVLILSNPNRHQILPLVSQVHFRSKRVHPRSKDPLSTCRWIASEYDGDHGNNLFHRTRNKSPSPDNTPRSCSEINLRTVATPARKGFVVCARDLPLLRWGIGTSALAVVSVHIGCVQFSAEIIQPKETTNSHAVRSTLAEGSFSIDVLVIVLHVSRDPLMFGVAANCFRKSPRDNDVGKTTFWEFLSDQS